MRHAFDFMGPDVADRRHPGTMVKGHRKRDRTGASLHQRAN